MTNAILHLSYYYYFLPSCKLLVWKVILNIIIIRILLLYWFKAGVLTLSSDDSINEVFLLWELSYAYRMVSSIHEISSFCGVCLPDSSRATPSELQAMTTKILPDTGIGTGGKIALGWKDWKIFNLQYLIPWGNIIAHICYLSEL